MSKDGLEYNIEELVQHVAIKFDEGSSFENALSATIIKGRGNKKSNEIFINRPFLFYVRDIANDVILTAGKIVEIPEEEKAIPVSFTVV
jgi:serine protease inhibitor